MKHFSSANSSSASRGAARGAVRLGLAALAIGLQLATPLASTTLAQSATGSSAPSRDILATAPSVQPGTPATITTTTTTSNGSGPQACADGGPADYPVSAGWFFTQEAHGCITGSGPERRRGYLVQDDDKGAFWTEFRRYGGLPVLGYPVSQPFHYPVGTTDGYWYQAFEKGILQWQPENGRAVLANVFDMFSEQKLDDDLAVLGIPAPKDQSANADTRISWLTEPLFMSRFFFDPVAPHSSDPDRQGLTAFTNLDQAEMFFGTPESTPDRLTLLGPRQSDGSRVSLYPLMHSFMAQRFQKGGMELFFDTSGETFQQPVWSDRPIYLDPTVVPGEARPGCVVVTAVGLLARSIGSDKIIPSAATEALPLDPNHPWVDTFVPPVVKGQIKTSFQLTGSGFKPNEMVTVRLTPAPNSGLQAMSFPPVKTYADGSFDVVFSDVVIGAYDMTATGSGPLDQFDGQVDLSVSTVPAAPTAQGQGQGCPTVGMPVGN